MPAMKNVAVNGVTLATHDEGTGSPILFVHGFPLSHSMWQPQIFAFAGDHRVIAPDLRGFGRSDVTEGTVTMEQHADDLADLLDELNVDEPVVLCGLSMGGYVAWQFQQKYRERLRGLILCDTRATADTPEGVENRKRLAKMVVENGSEAVASVMLPNLFSPKTGDRDPAVIDELRAIIVATSPQGIAAASLGMAERPDVTPLLPGIAADCRRGRRHLTASRNARYRGCNAQRPTPASSKSPKPATCRHSKTRRWSTKSSASSCRASPRRSGSA
jgi:3-oxoadipate enol-lactonase